MEDITSEIDSRLEDIEDTIKTLLAEDGMKSLKSKVQAIQKKIKNARSKKVKGNLEKEEEKVREEICKQSELLGLGNYNLI